MAYIPPNPNGQATKANSSPVTLASDQNNALETGGNLATIATNTGNGATSANQTNGTQQTKLTNGTNTADVVAGDSGFNGVAVASATKTYTFTTSSSGAQTILANTPTEGYSWITVHITSTGSGLAMTGQFSNASGGSYVNSNQWIAIGSTNPPAAIGTANAFAYVAPIPDNFFQLAVSALTSGTFSGTVTLSNRNAGYPNINASQTGTWNVGSSSATGSAVPANAFYAAMNANGNLSGLSSSNDAMNSGNVLAVDSHVYNGSTEDRVRSATAASNTTGTGLLGAGILGFDGTNYQRITVNSTTTISKNGADANILSILGTAPTTAGKLDVKGADGDVFVRQATAANLNATVVGTGTFAVQAALNAGSNIIGKVGIDQTTNGTTNAVVTIPATSGGTSIYSGSITNTVTAVKASAGQLYGWHLYNPNASVAYVQVFNLGTGSVTLGTTAPTMALTLPATSGATMNLPEGIAFGTAISIAVTTTRTGSAAPGSSVDLNFFYA